MGFKVKDEVIVANKFVGVIVNINEFREPSIKYAIDIEGYDEDVVFVGEEDIELLEAKDDES